MILVDVTVIFVEPENWGNVGSMARCMKNFGFEKLVLVTHDKPNGEAYTLAMHAKDVLDNATCVSRIEEALKRVDTSVAMTSKDGSDKNSRKVTLTPRQLSSVVKGKVGIVIGREGSGLTNGEIALCDVVTRIPTNPAYPVMNASHAACVMLYELSTIQTKKKYRNATGEEKESIMNDFDAIMKKIDFRDFKRRVASDVFSALIGRSFLTGREAYTLRGVLRKIERKLR